MPTIVLHEIHCYNPREIRDEPYLRADADSLNSSVIWGPASMGRGDTIDLSPAVDPIVFHDIAHVTLREEDRVGRDDHYGTMTFFANRGAARGSFYFPGDLNARYRINYEVLSEPTDAPDGRIELQSLVCNDPQGSRDEITLTVNDRVVAGPMRRMKEGWSINFADMPVSFQHACVIKLKDTQGQDWERSVQLIRGEYPLNVDQSHTFVATGRGITGDASYTLRYRMAS